MYSKRNSLQTTVLVNCVHRLFSFSVLLSNAFDKWRYSWGLSQRIAGQTLAHADSELEVVASCATDKVYLLHSEAVGSLGQHVRSDFQRLSFVYDVCDRG